MNLKMSFKLLSHNFNDLPSIEDRLKMRQYVLGVTPKIHFLSGQEHKIRLGNLGALHSI